MSSWAWRHRAPWFASATVVGFVEFEAAKIVERLLDDRIVDGHAGVDQRQRAERRDAAVVVREFGPVDRAAVAGV